jgi:hypothetical protein
MHRNYSYCRIVVKLFQAVEHVVLMRAPRKIWFCGRKLFTILRYYYARTHKKDSRNAAAALHVCDCLWDALAFLQWHGSCEYTVISWRLDFGHFSHALLSNFSKSKAHNVRFDKPQTKSACVIRLSKQAFLCTCPQYHLEFALLKTRYPCSH